MDSTEVHEFLGIKVETIHDKVEAALERDRYPRYFVAKNDWPDTWGGPPYDGTSLLDAMRQYKTKFTGPDPVEYGATHLTCVWCGYRDRIEFMQVTDYYSTDGPEVHYDKLGYWYECKNERACEQRVALASHG